MNVISIALDILKYGGIVVSLTFGVWEIRATKKRRPDVGSRISRKRAEVEKRKRIAALVIPALVSICIQSFQIADDTSKAKRSNDATKAEADSQKKIQQATRRALYKFDQFVVSIRITVPSNISSFNTLVDYWNQSLMKDFPQTGNFTAPYFNKSMFATVHYDYTTHRQESLVLAGDSPLYKIAPAGPGRPWSGVAVYPVYYILFLRNPTSLNKLKYPRKNADFDWMRKNGDLVYELDLSPGLSNVTYDISRHEISLSFNHIVPHVVVNNGSLLSYPDLPGCSLIIMTPYDVGHINFCELDASQIGYDEAGRSLMLWDNALTESIQSGSLIGLHKISSSDFPFGNEN